MKARVTLPLALVALALAGCGGQESTTSTSAPPTTIAEPPQPEQVVRDFLAQPSLDLLSPESVPRVSLERLRTRYAGLEGYRIVVSRRITEEFGVVGIRKGTRAEAFALRLVGDDWRIELDAPLEILRPGPDPGSRERVVAQIAVELKKLRGDAVAVMWLDRQTLDPVIYGGATSATVYMNLDPPVEPGLHSVVVFASSGREADATAWTFTAG